MRDSGKILAKHSRRRRRAALVIILLASSPALADDLDANPVQNLPPLPLKPNAHAQDAQTNPFCEPFGSLESLKIQLASGNAASSIKLKPIGAAIGLHSINDEGADKTSSAKMTIDPVPTAAIQTNPMAGSMHHHNDELVDAEVDDRAVILRPSKTAPSPQASANPTRRRSSIVLMPSVATVAAPVEVSPTEQTDRATDQAAPDPKVPGSNESALNERSGEPRLLLRSRPKAPVSVPSSFDLPLAAAQPTAPRQPIVAQALPGSEADEIATANREEEKSILFSLSDRSDSRQESQGVKLPANKQVDEPTTEVKGPATTERLATTEKLAEAERPAASDDPTVAKEADDVRIDLDVVKPIAINDPASSVALEKADPESGLKSMESVLTDNAGVPIAIDGSGRSVSKLDRPAEDSPRTKRYRPPVAVKQVPIAVVREASEKPASVAGSTVMPVDELNLDDFQPTPGSSKLTPLYMTRAQVRRLTLGGEVRRVKVVNESVCQAFTAGPNQLKLIGTGNGVTQLVVWADGDDKDAPPRMRSFEIHVKDSMQTTVNAVEQKARLLNQSISRAFPHANVVVRRNHGQLVVAGTCESETTAKSIMRMVRKTCTVPVKDELVVR